MHMITVIFFLPRSLNLVSTLIFFRSFHPVEPLDEVTDKESREWITYLQIIDYHYSEFFFSWGAPGKDKFRSFSKGPVSIAHTCSPGREFGEDPSICHLHCILGIRGKKLICVFFRYPLDEGKLSLDVFFFPFGVIGVWCKQICLQKIGRSNRDRTALHAWNLLVKLKGSIIRLGQFP